MKRLVLVLVVGLVACAPQNNGGGGGTGSGAGGSGSGTSTGTDFTGTYSGTLLSNVSCSDGSGASENVAVAWTLTDSGSQVTATFAGGCSPVALTGSGDVLQFVPKDCGSVQDSDGTTDDISIAVGTIEQLSATEIEMNFKFNEAISSGVNCESSQNGDLTKQ